MSTPDPIGAASREQRRKRRLATGQACALCGEHRLPALLEVDHYLGRNVDPDATWTLCRNCHTLETVRRTDLGIPTDAPVDGFDWVIAVVSGLGRLLSTIGKHLLLAAQWLTVCQAGLDEAFPAWRNQPWAVPP